MPVKLAGLAAGAVVACSAALARGYPDRTIAMMVPFAPGGPTDTVGRPIAEKMVPSLGRQIVIENVGGAGGTPGASRVAAAAPDGYTILFYDMSMSTSATLYRQLPCDPLTDFGHVGLVTDVPKTLIARKDPEPGDMPAFIDCARANPDGPSIANAGVGGASHMCGMLLMQALDVPMVTVRYKGSGPAMTDLPGGHVDLLCDQTTNTAAQITGGTVKAYAVTAPDRPAILPDLPTMAEAGLPDVNITIWHGIWTPGGTPAEISERLAAALRVALTDSDLAVRLTEPGTTPSPVADATPAALQSRTEADVARWKPIIDTAGVYAD